jgi:bilirubin oxidase
MKMSRVHGGILIVALVLILFAAGMTGCGGGGGGSAPAQGPDAAPDIIGDPLVPASIPKFVTPLARPGVMPNSGTADNYEIEIVQFQQQVLPAGYGPTTVWSYAAVGLPATRTYPAYTIEARVNQPVRVKWINNLKDASGAFLPHLLPIDQTLHWANPPMDCSGAILEGQPGAPGTECRSLNGEPYRGPVPIITHLHGAHVGPVSDGYPEAWYLPQANNIPAGYATEGKAYDDIFGGSGRGLGFAVFEYTNDQRATTLWYHDHTLGMTRANVYAGAAGFYLLRGGAADVDAAVEPGLPAGEYEIPLLIQDRSFNSDGSLFFPTGRDFFDGFTGPFIPETAIDGGKSDVSPIWNPEFFGNTMVVNGNTWPYLEVEPRRYRFRLLNGSDSRFLILTGDVPLNAAPLTFGQIGADGGFLPAPESRTELLLGPAERADVIVDFAAYQPGDTITLLNLGPDEPFGGGVPDVDFPAADPATTGQVMQFRVVALPPGAVDNSVPVAALALPAPEDLGAPTQTRRLSLNEEESATVCVDEQMNAVSCASPGAAPAGPTEALLGIVDAAGMPMPMEWMEQITENPVLGATEIWEIYNFTMDAHPIHIHLVQFEILDRQSLQTDAEGMAVMPVALVGDPRGPDPGESGRKDTVIVYPGEVARVKARFDLPGRFVWHCHILSHEDNEMMRPYHVGPLFPVAQWNETAMSMSPTLGTHMAQRTLAMMHTAIYDAVMAFDGAFVPYHVNALPPAGASPEAAVAAAARQVLAAVFTDPAHQAQIQARYDEQLAPIPGGQGKNDGIAFGQGVADAIMLLRSTDGAAAALLVPHPDGANPGEWRRTASGEPLAPGWGDVTPWAMTRGDQFDQGGPPLLTSLAYTTDYNEVRDLGAAASAVRTAEQGAIAQFWNPHVPAKWMGLGRDITRRENLSLADSARLFGLLSVTLADTAISGWNMKYQYSFWRPETAIRLGDADTNDQTVGDPAWASLLPAPAFPEYVSGHSLTCAAAATVLGRYLGSDDYSFMLMTMGIPEPRMFTSFMQAAQEAGQSRIWGGIHFRFSHDEGVLAGTALGQHVFDNFFRPR